MKTMEATVKRLTKSAVYRPSVPSEDGYRPFSALIVYRGQI